MDYNQYGEQVSSGGIGCVSKVAYDGAPTTARDTIQQALDTQEKALIHLHEILAVLEDRLSPVMGPRQPEPGTSAPAPTTASIVLDRVQQHRTAVSLATVRIDSILNRLHL